MDNGLPIIILLFCLLLTFAITPVESPALERMPIWDRISLSDVPIYASELLDRAEPPTTAPQGTWARFLKRSPENHSELLELESGGQFWTLMGTFFPLYYVVGADDLMVKLPGTGTPPNTVMLARAGDMVAVDRYHKGKMANHYFAISLDGKISGFAPIGQLTPVCDEGVE